MRITNTKPIKPNQDLRDRIAALGIFEWVFARKIGCADTTFSRWLREPLGQEDYRRKLIENKLDELEKAGAADGKEEKGMDGETV